MYALPDDFDPAVFVGQDLQRICFPPYGLELWFAKSIRLEVFGPATLGGANLREEDSSPQTLARLTGLPGHRIVRAGTERRGTLVLTFDDGQELRVIEDGDAYECYHLHIGEREIIVWHESPERSGDRRRAGWNAVGVTASGAPGAMAMSSVWTVEDLRGMALAGVAFVRDYVEFLFDGPIVRCYEEPMLVHGTHRLSVRDSGWRDGLCNLIGARVADAQVHDAGLCLQFEDDRAVRVDFRGHESNEGRESAEFVPMLEGTLAPEHKLVW